MAELDQSFLNSLRGFSTSIVKKLNITARLWFQQKGTVEMTAKGLQGYSVDDMIGSDPMRIMRPGSSKKVSPDKALAKISGWTFAAINAIASEISTVEFKLFQIAKDGSHEEQFEHDLLDLLEAGNPTQTGVEIRYTMSGHLEATGNAYLLMMGVKSENDKPEALFLLNPAEMEVDLDRTIYPYVLKGYKYTHESRKYYYKPYEIIHLKIPDLNDPYQGIGPLQSIAGWIDIDNFADEFNRQFFLNGARMDGVFETDYTNEEQVAALKLTYESNHQGPENAHKVGILPKGVHYKSTQSTMKDMDFGVMGDKSRDKILAGFRVSKTILGTAESDTNRSTAETADYVFAHRTIKPKMELICSYLNEYLAPRYGDNIYISFQDPTPEDKSFKIQEIQAMSASQPIMTINEIREKYMGLGPIDGGDEVFRATGMVPISTPAPTTTNNGNPGPKAMQKDVKPMQKQGKPIRTRAAQNFKARAKMTKTIGDSLFEKLKLISIVKQKDWREMSKSDFYFVWKDFSDRMDAKSPEVKKILNDINADQKKEVLSNLKYTFSKDINKKAELPEPFDIKAWIKITIAKLTPMMSEVYKNEGEIAGAGVGKPGINLLENQTAKDALDEAIELLSASYNQTTLDQLKAKLGEALTAGSSIQEATELVNSIYDFADVTRAETVAKTELFRIANTASKQAWKQAGVKEMMWQAFDDDLTCEFCREMDGKVESIENNFLDDGDTFAGDEGGTLSLDYADVGAPPLHPNCRCGLQPQEVPMG